MSTSWADLAERYHLQIIFAFGSRAEEVAALGPNPGTSLPESVSDNLRLFHHTQC